MNAFYQAGLYMLYIAVQTAIIDCIGFYINRYKERRRGGV